MDDESSFADLLSRLAADEPDAQAAVFKKFSERLVKLARARLDDRLRRTTDPDDVAQSVWKSFFVRQSDGQFEIKDWGGLWAILTVMTIRKCGRRSVAGLRNKRDVSREVSIQDSSKSGSSFDLPILDREPTPVEAASLSEFIEKLLTGLTDQEREIVVLRLQGHTVPEISDQVCLSERSTHRKLAAVRDRLEGLQASNEV